MVPTVTVFIRGPPESSEEDGEKERNKEKDADRNKKKRHLVNPFKTSV